MSDDRSVVLWYGADSGHKCGYCKSTNTNLSHGMWARQLTCADYQSLIDRGWRRSGKYVYKPMMDKTCCPMYTIRCRSFELSQSQKKVIKKVNKYLNHGVKSSGLNHDRDIPGFSDHQEAINHEEDQSKNEVDPFKVGDQSELKKTSTGLSNVADINSGESGESRSIVNMESQGITSQYKKGVGLDPTKPPPKKAKLLRLERKMNKHLNSNANFLNNTEKAASTTQNDTTTQNAIPTQNDTTARNGTTTQNDNTNQNLGVKIKDRKKKSLDDYLTDIIENPKHKLEVRLVKSCPRGQDFNESYMEGFNVYKKYQISIHGDEPDKVTLKQYTNFLVESPLVAEDNQGSYHHQYFLDGKLIAVGVLDILPNCVSSVYLFYDPQFEFLSLGTYSALREISLMQKLGIEFYYMGFYIHTCPKMRYKAQFSPSFLLCPEVYSWHPISECLVKLDAQKYSRFSAADSQKDTDTSNLREVGIIHRGKATTYQKLLKLRDRKVSDGQEVQEYADLVGGCLSKRLLLFRE